MGRIEEKNIATNVILSIVTCGIYGIFWFITITNDTKIVSGDQEFSGGKYFLLNLITCGIFGIYWGYKLGQNINNAKMIRNMPTEDLPILYLILMVLNYVCGVTGIVTYCLAQNELNEIAKLQNDQQ